MTNANESELLATDAATAAKRHLSIFDLMLAMAVVAISLMLEQHLPYGRGFGYCKDPFWFAIFFSQAVAANSLALFGILLLGRELLAIRKATTNYVCQPGHLLLLIQFLFFCLALAAGLYCIIFGEKMFPIFGTSSSVDLSFVIYSVRTICSLAILVGAGVIGGFVQKWNWIWVTSIASVSLLELLGLASQGYLIYSLCSNQPFGQLPYVLSLGTQLMLVIAGIFVLTASICDLRKGRSRDIPHWIGVIGWFVTYVVSVLLFRIAFVMLTPAELFGQ